MKDTQRTPDGCKSTGIGPSSQSVAGDGRALSDMIGYVLALAVILSSVALVSTFGLEALRAVQDNEQASNAERAFNVMAQNFDEIERGLAPSRTAEIDLHEGDLFVRNVTNFTVEVNHLETRDFTKRFFPKQIVIRPDPGSATIIVYQNGATIRGENGTDQGVIENQPRIVCNNEQAIVSITTLNTSEDRKLGGGNVRITGRHQRTDLVYPINRTGQNSSRNVTTHLNLTIDGGLERAWRRGLIQSAQNWSDVPHDDNEIYCPSPERVFVRETVINVSFVR